MNSKTDKDTHRITYHIFEISTEPFIPEIIGGLMWELDITGINELEDRLIVFANEDRDVNRRQFENLLIRLANENIIERYDIHQGEIKDRNWNEEWEKQINVIPISDHLIIKPTFRKYQKTSDQIVVTIDPKMSFGTGEHQSTKLGLLLLEKYIKPDNRVLDVGTGTGILAISALKMGAGYALAIDIDDWSVLNSRENAKLNSVLGKIVIRKADIRQVNENNFDLILANINKKVLSNICSNLKDHLNPKGLIILSGLIKTDEINTVQLYEKCGFKKIDGMEMDEWIAIVLKVS